MRLKQRKRVDLPHPDGPMIAVTSRSGNVRLMFLRTCLGPYQKLNAFASALSAVVGGASVIASPLDSPAEPIAQIDGNCVQAERERHQHHAGGGGVDAEV